MAHGTRHRACGTWHVWHAVCPTWRDSSSSSICTSGANLGRGDAMRAKMQTATPGWGQVAGCRNSRSGAHGAGVRARGRGRVARVLHALQTTAIRHGTAAIPAGPLTSCPVPQVHRMQRYRTQAHAACFAAADAPYTICMYGSLPISKPIACARHAPTVSTAGHTAVLTVSPHTCSDVPRAHAHAGPVNPHRPPTCPRMRPLPAVHLGAAARQQQGPRSPGGSCRRRRRRRRNQGRGRPGARSGKVKGLDGAQCGRG